MKKRLLAVLFATMMMALSFTACGSTTDNGRDVVEDVDDEDDEDEDEDEDEVETEEETEEEASVDVSAEGEYANLEALFNDPDVKAGLEEQYANMSTEDLIMTVSAEGNTMIITAQALDIECNDDYVAAFEQALDGMESVMVSQIDSLSVMLTDKNATIRVTYIDKNGTEIASRDFSK